MLLSSSAQALTTRPRVGGAKQFAPVLVAPKGLPVLSSAAAAVRSSAAPAPRRVAVYASSEQGEWDTGCSGTLILYHCPLSVRSRPS